MSLAGLLSKREELLERWAAACTEVVAYAGQLDSEGVAASIAERESILTAIMSANHNYSWSARQLKRMRELEDQVELAVADCYAQMRDQVTNSRRRRTGISMYAGQARGG